MSKAKHIRVTITARETVRYRKTLDIPIDAVAEYEAVCDRGEDDEWFAQFADRYLDITDDPVGNGFEDVELFVGARRITASQ